MAPEMKATILPTDRLTMLRKYSLENLWQVPTFIMGVCLLIGVWLVRPLWHDTGVALNDHELTKAREALERKPPAPLQVLSSEERLLAIAEKYPKKAGEVHFLLGSSYLLAAGASKPEEIDQDYRRARTHLEQANALGIEESDHARMIYRLGVAWSHVGENPEKVIAALTGTVETAADDYGEGYGILARSYLNLPEPDLRAALEATRKQLAQAIDDEDLLAPARLREGELFLKLEQPAEAKKILARIGASAPQEIVARARQLRAGVCQREHAWAEAAELWEQTLADPARTPDHPERIHYDLGRCYRELQQDTKAIQSWELVIPFGGIEAQAASFALAEVQLESAKPEVAFSALERALRDVASAATYRNPLVTIKQARRIVERGCQCYLERKDYAHALGLARLYERLAPSGVAQELAGATSEAWAKNRQEAKDDIEAKTHFHDAAAAFESRAALAVERAEKARWLKRSSASYSEARDHAKVIAVTRLYLEVESEPGRLGEAWFTLAMAHEALSDAPAALADFHKCIEYPGLRAFEARFRLAETDIAASRLDDAEEALKQNLELMRSIPDNETRQKTLFTLASLLYSRGNHAMAALRLQEALDRYPAAPRTLEARFQLADCYRRLATQEYQKQRGLRLSTDALMHYRDQYRLYLKKAVAYYQKILDDLNGRQAGVALSMKEAEILQQTEFALAECRFDLGEYDEALRLNTHLAESNRDRPEYLSALRQAWRCHWVMRQPDKARTTVRDMRDALGKLNDQAFHNHPDHQTREEWQQWLDWAEKQ